MFKSKSTDLLTLGEADHHTWAIAGLGCVRQVLQMVGGYRQFGCNLGMMLSALAAHLIAVFHVPSSDFSVWHMGDDWGFTYLASCKVQTLS